jgi:hypothetical protein
MENYVVITDPVPNPDNVPKALDTSLTRGKSKHLQMYTMTGGTLTVMISYV